MYNSNLPVAPNASRHSKGFLSSVRTVKAQTISCLKEKEKSILKTHVNHGFIILISCLKDNV